MSRPRMLPIETDVQTLSELRSSGADFLLLDVREVPEFENCRIDGSKLIPMSELGGRLVELEPYRDRHIVVHCHHGGRSMRVTQYLRDQGFAQTQNLAGGIDEWSIQIDPEVPRY